MAPFLIAVANANNCRGRHCLAITETTGDPNESKATDQKRSTPSFLNIECDHSPSPSLSDKRLARQLKMALTVPNDSRSATTKQ